MKDIGKYLSAERLLTRECNFHEIKNLRCLHVSFEL
jgi:hypothetical protein